MPDAEILFVGALADGDGEGTSRGFRIIGLPVAVSTGKIWRNLLFVPKLLMSLWKARSVVKISNQTAR